MIDWPDIGLHVLAAVISTAIAAAIHPMLGAGVVGANLIFWPARESIQKSRGFHPLEWSRQVQLEAFPPGVASLATSGVVSWAS